jgi:predicted RNase H-like HicB family nuclease
MTKGFNAVISREGDWYIAQCLEVDVASQGETEEEALVNLNEALLLHFAPPVAN